MERIVVGIDGSEGSGRALRWALGEGRLRQAAVEVVHAWHPPYIPSAYPFSGLALDAEVYEKAAAELLGSAVDAQDTTGLAEPVARTLVTGGAAEAVLTHAKGADLIVIGSRGHGGFTGLLLGSVSNQIVHHATCPVVVVPHAADVPASG